MILFLKAAVIVMGILIVAGLAVIGVKIYQKAGDAAESLSVETPQARAAPTPFSTGIEHLGLGPGAQVTSMVAEDDRLILGVRSSNGVERVVIIDMNSGAVLGEVTLAPPLR